MPERTHVFVYGTLMPGQLRWPWLAPYVTAHHPDRVTGRLYDTGKGFPAAVFDEPGMVHGVCCTLDELMADEAWAMLDDIEGRLYERCTVTTAKGRTAGSYAWAGDRDGLVPVDGPWTGE